MRKHKIFAATLFTLALLLTGCGQSAETNDTIEVSGAEDTLAVENSSEVSAEESADAEGVGVP